MALETGSHDADADPGPSEHERDLVARAKAGDYDAFEEIVKTHQGRVFAVALGVTKNKAEAEEVSQETFLSAFEHLDTFRGDAQLSSWLFRVATNHALMKLRKKKPEAMGGLTELEPMLQSITTSEGTNPFSPLAQWARRPDEAAQQKEITEAVQAGLDALPDEDRAMLVLRAFEGMSHQEIADTLHTTVPAVKSRLHRARLALRSYLTDRLDAPRGP